MLNIHWKDWSWSYNTLATWCEETTYWKRPWCWGKIESEKRMGWQRMRWLDSITDSMSMNLSRLRDSGRQGSLACCSLWGHKESHMSWWLNKDNSNWKPEVLRIDIRKGRSWAACNSTGMSWSLSSIGGQIGMKMQEGKRESDADPVVWCPSAQGKSIPTFISSN